VCVKQKSAIPLVASQGNNWINRRSATGWNHRGKYIHGDEQRGDTDVCHRISGADAKEKLGNNLAEPNGTSRASAPKAIRSYPSEVEP
jgi:hypothetical protein